MKFYDLEWLAEKCGTDNKYEITVKVAAEARRESEEVQIEKGTPGNERYISNVLLEIEEDRSPINAKKKQTLDDLLQQPELSEQSESPEQTEQTEQPEQTEQSEQTEQTSETVDE